MHLLRDEIVESAAFVDLRKLPVITEGIWIPADACGNAILLLEVALANKELADERLATGKIEVRLDPHATDDLPATLLDALLDLLVELRILVGHPGAVLGGGLGKGVVGIFVHQLERRGECAADNVDRLAPRPEPCGIDVRVAG